MAKAEQAAETRASLLAVGRALFGEKTFAGTSTEAILEAAKITRGALYYHFEDKADLMRAVCDEVYAEIGAEIEARASRAKTAWEGLVAGCEAFLDAASEPSVVRILFLDGPAVLGREAWEEIETRHGVRSLEAGVGAAMNEGAIVEQPIAPLAAVLNGALNEGVLWSSRQPNRRRAASETRKAIRHLLEALRAASRQEKS